MSNLRIVLDIWLQITIVFRNGANFCRRVFNSCLLSTNRLSKGIIQAGIIEPILVLLRAMRSQRITSLSFIPSLPHLLTAALESIQLWFKNIMAFDNKLGRKYARPLYTHTLALNVSLQIVPVWLSSRAENQSDAILPSLKYSKRWWYARRNYATLKTSLKVKHTRLKYNYSQDEPAES